MWEILKDYYIQENGEDVKVLSKGEIVNGSLVSGAAGDFWLAVTAKDNSLLLDQKYYRRFQVENTNKPEAPKKVGGLERAKRAALLSVAFLLLLTIFYFIQKSRNNGRSKKGQ